MARVNISVPDQLYEQARRAGLNISQVAQQGITTELQRRSKCAELDAQLAELEAELGPISPADQSAARDWADRVLGATAQRDADSA